MILVILILSSSAAADRLVRLYDVSRGSAMKLIEDGYDVTNVDIRGGYVYNMEHSHGSTGHRKNMNFTLGDGVDLNRNWGYMWGYDNTGSSGSPTSETYRGTSAFSEPEPCSIKRILQYHHFRGIRC